MKLRNYAAEILHVRILFIAAAALMLTAGYNPVVNAQDEVDISGEWFLSYQQGDADGKNFSKFYVHRGYLNFKSEFSSVLSGRITPDLTIDDAGDVKVRLKYLYMKFKLPEHSFFTKSYVEYCLVHRPWLDFEQHINYYRLQGTMYLERVHLFNSADFGVTAVTNFGGEIDKDYQENVSKYYPGKYGGAAVGIFNGGGYHAAENNKNKLIEGRFTLRPLPENLPGLQVSYFGVFGKGNIAEEPDFVLNTAFLSYEHRKFIGTATYFTGKGNSKGNAVDAEGVSLKQSGYSFFGEVDIPETKFSVIGRYDVVDPNTTMDNDVETRIIAGLVYKFYGHHKALIDYDYLKSEAPGFVKDKLIKFTVQVNF